MARSNNKHPKINNVPNPVEMEISTVNTSSLSSGVTHATNLTCETNSTVQTSENRQKQSRDPARQRNEENYCQPSKKRACKRPNKEKFRKDQYKQKEKQQRKFRQRCDDSMQKDPELYRIHNVTDYHCRHFVRKGDADDEIYCGYIYCSIYHEQYLIMKITKANTGKFFVLSSEINTNGVQYLVLWNMLRKRHLSEKNNVLGTIEAYKQSLPYTNS